MRNHLIVAAALTTLAACSSSDAPRRRASADLDPRSGSAVTGHVELDEKSGGVALTVTLSGADPGQHGMHIHQVGDCSAEDASSAGDHWNPDGMHHGAPRAAVRHAGDLGNITVGADGRGQATVVIPGLTVRPGVRSVVGHSIVVHAKPDDLKTQPSGDSGDRIACGVIAIRLK
jgi:Cu-Zn family superoxide dismutase